MLPHDRKPWAKTLARTVICTTVTALAVLAYFLKAHNYLHIPEIVGIFLLFLTIVPPNLAIIYPWLLPANHSHTHGAESKSAVR